METEKETEMETEESIEIGYFEEDVRQKSSMRLMCFFSLLTSIGFGVLTVVRPTGEDGVYFTIAFLLGAFIPKIVQKFSETR